MQSIRFRGLGATREGPSAATCPEAPAIEMSLRSGQVAAPVHAAVASTAIKTTSQRLGIGGPARARLVPGRRLPWDGAHQGPASHRWYATVGWRLSDTKLTRS